MPAPAVLKDDGLPAANSSHVPASADTDGSLHAQEQEPHPRRYRALAPSDCTLFAITVTACAGRTKKVSLQYATGLMGALTC